MKGIFCRAAGGGPAGGGPAGGGPAGGGVKKLGGLEGKQVVVGDKQVLVEELRGTGGYADIYRCVATDARACTAHVCLLLTSAHAKMRGAVIKLQPTATERAAATAAK